jgi:heat shock protein 5
LIIDTTPLTLGIETTGGVFTEIIHRQTSIPTQKSQIFSTDADNQDRVRIRVYEGERPLTKDNNLLGSFELSGIPPAPRGVPQIEVMFELDRNGILTVSASDKSTERRNRVTITQNGRLSKEDIDMMVKAASEFAMEDAMTKKELEAMNGLTSFVHTVKGQIADPDGWSKKVRNGADQTSS